MAQFEPSGKAADIFSLGAMYLEMIALCDHKRLDFMRKLRPDRDHSFQANLSHSQSWLDAISPTTQETDSDLLKLISEMLAFDPTKRPDTVEVNARLSVYTSDLEQHLQAGTYSLRYYDTCCRHVYLGHREQFYIDAQWTRHQAPAKSDWLIRKADKKAFDTLFNKIDTKRTGSISKVQVLASFSIWGLSDETLLKIWKLAAIRYGDWLGRDEFAVAMFLIRSQCGSLKHLPTRIPHKLIPPSLRPILHLKEDSPRGYLYNCPKADCPFQLEKGLTGPEQLKQHLSIFHLEIAPRRLSGIFRDLGRLSPKQEVTDTRPSRLGDSKARMKEATTSELEVLPGTRLSLLEQSKSRMRGATFSEMEILPEIFEEVRLV
jgi:serine/threonine protein kinase